MATNETIPHIPRHYPPRCHHILSAGVHAKLVHPKRTAGQGSGGRSSIPLQFHEARSARRLYALGKQRQLISYWSDSSESRGYRQGVANHAQCMLSSVAPPRSQDNLDRPAGPRDLHRCNYIAAQCQGYTKERYKEYYGSLQDCNVCKLVSSCLSA